MTFAPRGSRGPPSFPLEVQALDCLCDSLCLGPPAEPRSAAGHRVDVSVGRKGVRDRELPKRWGCSTMYDLLGATSWPGPGSCGGGGAATGGPPAFHESTDHGSTVDAQPGHCLLAWPWEPWGEGRAGHRSPHLLSMEVLIKVNDPQMSGLSLHPPPHTAPGLALGAKEGCAAKGTHTCFPWKH